MVLKPGILHRVHGFYQVCSNDDLELTLTFAGRSFLLPGVLILENFKDFVIYKLVHRAVRHTSTRILSTRSQNYSLTKIIGRLRKSGGQTIDLISSLLNIWAVLWLLVCFVSFGPYSLVSHHFSHCHAKCRCGSWVTKSFLSTSFVVSDGAVHFASMVSIFVRILSSFYGSWVTCEDKPHCAVSSVNYYL